MSKEQVLEYEGKVLELLPQAHFKILLDNGHEIKAVISGKLRKNRIRILTGEEQSPEKACVGGANPSRSTTNKITSCI